MMRNPLEYPILMDINHDRSKEGLSPIVKLTVPVLKTHLRGKSINGSEWKMGSKKREDLIEDYRSASSLPDYFSRAALSIIPAFLNQRKGFSIIPWQQILHRIYLVQHLRRQLRLGFLSRDYLGVRHQRRGSASQPGQVLPLRLRRSIHASLDEVDIDLNSQAQSPMQSREAHHISHPSLDTTPSNHVQAANLEVALNR